jgi:rubredoxin-NAD+ reductase
MNPILIIGAGLAGWTTARELRKLDPTTPVVVIAADSGDFYAKPSLSNAFAQGKGPAQLISTPADKMAEALNVTLLAHTRVKAIDTAAQTVTTRAGPQAYSRLVLATGALPIRVPIEGDAVDQVLSVNSLQDFAALHAQLQPGSGAGREVLIMGAGLIGCEFANDLASAGFRVSVVDPGARPLAALLPEAASTELRQALEALGVRFHFGSTVVSVQHGAAGEGLQVLLSNGHLAQAASVLSAIGLRADTVLAKAAGLSVERGIVVNRQLQTSSTSIYALGDCAQYDHGVTLPYVMPIMTAARALAATLAGTPTDAVFPLMPVSVKTPALPLVLALPRPGSQGQWSSPEAGLWQWLDEAGVQRGFVLSGRQTAQRMAQSKQVVLQAG